MLKEHSKRFIFLICGETERVCTQQTVVFCRPQGIDCTRSESADITILEHQSLRSPL